MSIRQPDRADSVELNEKCDLTCLFAGFGGDAAREITFEMKNLEKEVAVSSGK